MYRAVGELLRRRGVGVVSDYFKLKYWGRQSEDYILPSPHLGREYLVFGKLMIKLSEWAQKGLLDFDVYIRPTGVGTLTNSINDQRFTGLEDKFDFTLFIKRNGSYYPLAWLDVTGSSWTEEQSRERYGEPVYAILSVKVETAKRYNVEGRVWFLHYADSEDKLKVISASRILELEKLGKVRKDKFEAGAVSDYFLIPVKYWKGLSKLRTALRRYFELVVRA